MGREARIEFKATPEEKAVFQQMAAADGMELSGWIRTKLREACPGLKPNKDRKDPDG